METRLDVSVRDDQYRLLVTRIEGYLLMNTSIKLKERRGEGERERETKRERERERGRKRERERGGGERKMTVTQLIKYI
ncbi:MAG: hypothetical protein MJE68_12570 [Proteobacteria bacterium]|nr:hypothetical protein [Pseudomonadota bacterium]